MISYDIIIVTFAMIIGFSVIMMKFTGYWPCKIGEVFNIANVSCEKSAYDNVVAIANNVKFSLHLDYAIQSPQNILLLLFPK
jgi:hypothetical protein